MNLRTLLSLAGAAAVLAACGGGGSGSSAPSSLSGSTQSQSNVAYGTLTFTTNQTKAAGNIRKPRYVSPGTTHATLFIDQGAADRVTCNPGTTTPSTSGTCVIPWTSTSGTHTFVAEIDDGTNVLAEGGAQYVLLAGSNTLSPLTLNGVAATGVVNAPTSCTSTSCTGTFAIADADVDPIVPPGYFDNAVALTGSGSVESVFSYRNLADYNSNTYFNGFPAPDGSGTDYVYLVICNSGATGTFTLSLELQGIGPVFVDSTVLAALSLTYPAPTGNLVVYSSPTFTCTNGTISAPANGNLTVNGATRK
jgi:hypothetical protein